ncbi:MAG: TetR family transcriptional regulator [Actinophytocola sp.]|uniref:TetR/AcrR family transcriptional regulator n=1 Tax=Actinophytocola sp. TaxID=1872138 RepID=UPI0013241ACE|nr:TetR/AcrR family transcriptional regulator [Actinophytocola sp.]MPZ85348.1 TetR family transcriptional regulator [Actinophytocola sp.]
MTRRGPGRPRDPATDAAILAAAMELFVERGIDAMSIEQVAKRAGVAKLTVYRRWTAKEQLVAHAIEWVIEQHEWPSNAEIATGTPAEIVESTLDASAELAASPEFRALIARILGSSVSNPTLMATYWKHYILPRREATAVMLDNAKQAGMIAADADVDVLMDMMAGAVVYRVLQPDPPDAAEMRRYLTELYRRAGLLP